MVAIPVPAAGAGVGGSHQCDPGREAGFEACAAEPVDPFLQRLPQLIQHGSGKFRQFIEEEHAPMGEADFTGAGAVAAPEQGRCRAAVVRCPEGPGPQRHQGILRLPGHRADARDGERLL